FKRSSERVAPHNSYISFANIEKGAKQKNYSMNNAPKKLLFLANNEIEAIEGDEISSISIHYGSNPTFNSTFVYEKDIQKYIRISDGTQTVDEENNNPIAVDNVFIVEASHKVIDSKGRRSIDLASGGKAYLFQKGKWKEVTWENVNGRLLPFANGEQVGLVPGKTWINIIPSNPGLNEDISLK
ncbi:MAG TPA: DUF3048 C-terminal domain-containing protein, partial [Niallia sp.]|nr:DUF3048 C-terminal domain-containing protein [Niallia sp.]